MSKVVVQWLEILCGVSILGTLFRWMFEWGVGLGKRALRRVEIAGDTLRPDPKNLHY